MVQPVNIQVGGNVSGNIVVGDHNLVVNTNHGTLIYKQAAPRVKPRDFAPQPPRPPRGFTGRAAELQKLQGWISSNEIVLLHGPDGMGKSALLRQAANSQAARAMPAGVIPLEPPDAEGQTGGPDDLVQTLFDALFESQPRLKVTTQTARSYLSNTRPLILLDEVPLPQGLLHDLPDLFPQGSILMAADVPGMGDFQRLPVGPLPRGEALTLLAGRAGLDVNDDNRPALNALCLNLGDTPLALVITGNALRETGATLADALEKIGAAAASTVGETQAGPAEAQEALDRAFSFVFGLLKPEEQKILSTAALSPGLSNAPEWLGSALGGQDASTFIQRLKDLELLFANSPRLRLPPGLRLPAQKNARAVLSETAVFTNLIGYLGRGLTDPDFISAELGNLLGAIAWAARHAEWQAVIQLGRAVDAYLTLNGLWDAWGNVLELLRETAAATSNGPLQGWVLHQLGTRMLALGDRAGGEGLLHQALRLRQESGDATGAAFTQHNLNLLLPPPPPPPTGPRTPWLWPALGVTALLLAGLASLVGLVYFLRPTPPPVTVVTITVTATSQPGLPPSLTPTKTATHTPTPSPTPTATFTPSPTATPQGGSGLLVFQSLPPGSKEEILYSLSVDVKAPQPLLTEPMPAREPAWSPDGARVAFSSLGFTRIARRQIFSVDASGGNLQQLTDLDGSNTHPTWSPDGKQLAFLHTYSNGGSDLYIINLDGSLFDNQSPYLNLTNSDATGAFDYPEWSPDGARLAYQAYVDGNWEIFVLDVDGKSKPVQLTRAKNPENDWSIQPSWSPDGRMIAFASNRSGNWDIYVMNRRGDKLRPLTQDEAIDLQPDWSPDGLLLAFSSNRDGIQQIYLITTDGANIRPVTKSPGSSQEPDWRP